MIGPRRQASVHAARPGCSGFFTSRCLLVLTLLMLLTACGQKGPLYIPAAPADQSEDTTG